jgi:hypothetical protein
MPVDRRGELGADQADVLFFKKGRYDYKAIRDFRATLLQDNNIKTAYDSASQFEGPWHPHLTLGYPATPAKSRSPTIWSSDDLRRELQQDRGVDRRLRGSRVLAQGLLGRVWMLWRPSRWTSP